MTVERNADPGAGSGRIEVVGGGTPTSEQLAALVVALTPGDAGDDEATGPGSAWREASLLEGVGFRPFVSVDDVERYHRSLA